MSVTETFQFSDGLVAGDVIQFADGRWPGVVGAGITMTEDCFDLVEPLLRAVSPDWTANHRYGVFELKAQVRQDLAKRLLAEVDTLPLSEGQVRLFTALAGWLEERLDGWKPVSIFGI